MKLISGAEHSGMTTLSSWGGGQAGHPPQLYDAYRNLPTGAGCRLLDLLWEARAEGESSGEKPCV